MKRNLKILGELWKVQTINYFTDATNVVLGIILTAVTMVCWVGFKPSVGSYSTDYFVFASACGISIIRNSQYDLDLTVTDWRDKGLFKRFSTTPVPNWLLWVAILTFNWFINIGVSVFLFALAMIFESQREILPNIQWGPFMAGFIMDVFLSQFMAFFLSVLWKNRALILVVSLVSYFGPMYLLGLGIPWSAVGNHPWLNYFLYIAPHRYPLALMQAGWAGTASNYMIPLAYTGGAWDETLHAYTGGTKIYVNMFFPIRDPHALDVAAGVVPGDHLSKFGFGYGAHINWSDDHTKVLSVTKGAGWWLPFIVSIAWSALFAGVTYAIIKKRLYFGQRQYKQFQGVQKHLHYISQIKKAKNFTELEALMTKINASENRKMPKFKVNPKYKNKAAMDATLQQRDDLSERYE